jgi:hypothetical protein
MYDQDSLDNDMLDYEKLKKENKIYTGKSSINKRDGEFINNYKIDSNDSFYLEDNSFN